MDAASLVKLATSVRLDVASIGSRLAMRSGGLDDAARKADAGIEARVARRVNELADDFGLLTDRSAQRAVGPTVNVATQARLLLGPLDRSAPFRTPSPEALRGIDQFLDHYIELARGWASRAS